MKFTKLTSYFISLYKLNINDVSCLNNKVKVSVLYISLNKKVTTASVPLTQRTSRQAASKSVREQMRFVRLYSLFV